MIQRYQRYQVQDVVLARLLTIASPCEPTASSAVTSVTNMHRKHPTRALEISHNTYGAISIVVYNNNNTTINAYSPISASCSTNLLISQRQPVNTWHGHSLSK